MDEQERQPEDQRRRPKGRVSEDEQQGAEEHQEKEEVEYQPDLGHLTRQMLQDEEQ